MKTKPRWHNDDTIREIQKLAPYHTRAELAKKYDVHPKTILNYIRLDLSKGV
jgi:hypothetical protein